MFGMWNDNKMRVTLNDQRSLIILNISVRKLEIVLSTFDKYWHFKFGIHIDHGKLLTSMTDFH